MIRAPSLPAKRFTLSSGATLLVSRRRGAPVCAMRVHIRGGPGLDPAGLEGCATLAGALVDQGTRTWDEEAIATRLENAGGAMHGDATGVSGSIVSAGWETLLTTMAESVTAPTYPKVRVMRQRQRLLDRLAVERDDPRVQGGLLFRRLIYGDHWLGRPDHGTYESVAGIERRHLIAFHKRNWCASRAIIGFCGDVDPDQVRRFLERRFKHWNPGRPLADADPSFPVVKSRTAAFSADRQQVHLFLGHLGVRRNHPDYPALIVMDHILGTGPGFSNRISRILRDEKGLAYSVHAAISTSAGVLPGTFTAYIGTSPQHVPTAVRGFLDEMRRIRTEPVTIEELTLARDYLTGSSVLGFERASRRVRSLVFRERMGLPTTHLKQLIEAIGRVSIADVQRVASTHLDPENASLAAAGPVDQRTLDGALVAAHRSAAKSGRKKRPRKSARKLAAS